VAIGIGLICSLLLTSNHLGAAKKVRKVAPKKIKKKPVKRIYKNNQKNCGRALSLPLNLRFHALV
jgi:hypothetical protein